MVFKIVFSAAFVVIGLISILVAVIQFTKANRAKDWPTAPGVILSSSLNTSRYYDSEGGSTSAIYTPQIAYTYTLMGKPYNGFRLSFGTVSYDYNTAVKKLTPYPPNTPVTVHYDPNDPTQSVLETKASVGNIFLALGIIFVIVGVLSALFLPVTG